MLLGLLPGLFQATPVDQRARLDRLLALGDEWAPHLPTGIGLLHLWIELAQAGIVQDLRSGLPQAHQAVNLARQQGADGLPDTRCLYRALALRARILLTQADLEAGERDLAEARSIESAEWPAVLRQTRWHTEIWLADRRRDGAGMHEASLRYAGVLRQAGAPAWMGDMNLVNSALAAHRPQEAVRHGMRAIALLEKTREFARLTYTRIQLMAALIQTQRLGEARACSQAIWLEGGRLEQPDAWADNHAMLAALEGRFEQAALLHGYSENLCQRSGIIRSHNEAEFSQQTRDILLRALGAAGLARAIDAARQLAEQDLADIAFGPADGMLTEPANRPASDPMRG